MQGRPGSGRQAAAAAGVLQTIGMRRHSAQRGSALLGAHCVCVCRPSCPVGALLPSCCCLLLPGTAPCPKHVTRDELLHPALLAAALRCRDTLAGPQTHANFKTRRPGPNMAREHFR